MVFRFLRGSCYKRRWRGTNVRRERAALGIAKDAENALRAQVPEERVMISWFKMLVETLYGRRPFEARRKASRVCRLVRRFTLWIRRSNHRMAGSITCVPIRRMNRIMLRNCRCLAYPPYA